MHCTAVESVFTRKGHKYETVKCKTLNIYSEFLLKAS